jgi:large repetitive protein
MRTQYAKPRPTAVGLLTAFCAALGALFLAVGPLGQVALATSDKDSNPSSAVARQEPPVVVLTPLTGPYDAPLSFRLQLTNPAGNRQPICTLILGLPVTFSGIEVASPPTGWHATPHGKWIIWQASEDHCLEGGQTVTFLWSALCSGGHDERDQHNIVWRAISPPGRHWNGKFEFRAYGGGTGTSAPAMDLQAVPSAAVVQPGQPFTYVVTLTNTGDQGIAWTDIAAVVPPGFTYTGWQGDEEISQSTASPPTFRVEPLGVGASKLLSLEFRATSNAAELDDPVTLALTAAGLSVDSTPVAAEPVTVRSPLFVPGAGLEIFATAHPGVVVPGQRVSYDITVTNTGDQTLYNVDVADAVADGLTLVAAQLPVGVVWRSSPPLTYRLAELGAGAGRSFTLEFTATTKPLGSASPVTCTFTGMGRDVAGNPVLAAPYAVRLPLGTREVGLDIQKTCTGAVIVPGEPVTYQLAVANTGDTSLSAVFVTDISPATLTFLNAVHDGDVVRVSTNPPAFLIPALPAYTTKLIGVSYDTDADYSVYPDTLVTTATARADGPGGVGVKTAPAEAAVPVAVRGASLQLSKVCAHAAQVVLGRQTTYTITICNHGDQDLHDITIYDLPNHILEYAYSQLGRVIQLIASDPPTFRLDQLPVHAEHTIAVTFDAQWDGNAGQILVTNGVWATAHDESGALVVADTTVSRLPILRPSSGLRVNKIATSGQIIPGSTVTYIISAENYGDLNLTDVTLTDLLPAGLSFAFADPGPGLVQTSAAPPTFQVPLLLSGGTATLALTCTAAADSAALGPEVINVAEAFGYNEPGALITAAPDSAVLPVVAPSRGLDVQKAAIRDRIVPGKEIGYLITVANTGKQPLMSVEVVDEPPAGLIFSRAEHDESVVQAPGSPPTFRIPTLADGEHELISLLFVAAEDPTAIPNPAINRATARGFTLGEQEIVALPDSSVLPVVPDSGAIDIEKAAVESPFPAGGLGHYIITVTNTGPVRLSGVTAHDVLPQGLTYIDAEPVATQPAPGMLTWDLNDLEPGRSHTIVLSVGVDYALHGQTVTNTVDAAGVTPDTRTVTDVDATTTPCRAEDSSIHVDKLPNDTRLLMGGQISYHILVANDGGLPLDSLIVRDSIPDGLSFVNADFDTEVFDLVTTDPVVELRLDPGRTLPPTSEEAITLFFNAERNYTLYNLAPLDSTVINRVAVSGRDPKMDFVTDSDAAALELISPRAAIQVHYAHTTGEIVPDELATYLVTLENIGDQSLTDVELAIAELDAQGLAYVESNYDTGHVTTAHGGGYHRWRLTTPMPAGSAEQVRITYRASRDILNLVPGGVVTSTATVSGRDPIGDPVGDSGAEAVPLSPKRGAVTIDNTAAQGEIMPGETVTYILTVSAGPELDLADLVVTAQNLSAQHLTLVQVSFDTDILRQTGTFTWTARDTFPAGAQEEIRVTYRAAESAGDMPLHVHMQATVSAHDVYGRALSDSDEEILPVLLPESHLLLEKTTLATAIVPGETATFLLTATNNGNQDLAELRIVEDLPDQLSPLAWYAESEHILYDDSDPTAPSWTLTEDLGQGEAITIRFVAASDPDPALYGETLTNVIAATAEDEAHGTLEARAADEVPVHTPDVAVEVTKTPSQSVIVPGGTASYNLVVANVGRTDLTAITLTEDVPGGLSYVSSFYDAAQVTLVDTDPSVVWQIGPLAPGRSVDIQIAFAVTADPARLSNPVVNTVTAAATGPGNQVVTDLDQASLPVQDSAPSVHIEKHASVSVVRTGERLEYVITVTNDGSQPLSNAVVTDALPLGLTYLTSRFDENLATLSATEPTATWELTGELSPGDWRSIYLTALVAAEYDSVAHPVANSAEVHALAPGEVEVADADTETLPLQRSGPRITVQKSTTAPVVWPGQDILYVIEITNTGTRDIVRGLLLEQVPQGLSFGSSVYDPFHLSFGGNTPEPLWAFSDLPVGATETVTVRLHAEGDIRGLDNPVVNVASVEAWDEYGTYFTDSDFETTPLADLEPALALNASATTGTIVPGGEVTYLVNVTNTGNEDLFSVVVADTLPSGLSILSTDFDPLHVVETRGSTSPGAPLRGTTPDGRDVLTWTMQVLPQATSEGLRLSCSVTDDGTQLDSLVANTFRVGAVSAGHVEIIESDGDVLPVVLPGSAVGIDKAATQGDIVPGELITYLITVRNAGATRLAGLRVTDMVPDGFTFQQSNYDNTIVDFLGVSADSAVWTLADLPVGGYEQIGITYLAASDLTGNVAADTLATEVVVEGRDPSGTTVTDADTEALPIHPQRAGIQLLKWADAMGGLAVQGAEIAYHVQVVNTGEQDLAPVTVIDYLPRGLRYLEADIAPDSVVAAANETRAYWTRPILHSVESWEVLVRARIDTALVDGAVVQNRATAIGIDQRGGEVRSSDVSRVLAGLPTMNIEKTVDRPSARPSDKLTYTITYRNSGTADAENVVVMDVLPAEMTYVPGSATGGAFYESSARAVTRTRDRLEIDQGAIFSYQVTLATSATLGTRIPNVAEVYAQGLSPALSDTAWVLVADQPAELVKTVDKSVAVVGDTLAYTLTYQNLSPADFDSVTITDQVPSELDHFYSGSGNEGVYDPGLRRITWDIGPVSAGHVGSVSFHGIVRPDAAVTGRVANQGTLTADGTAIESNRAVTLIVEDVAVALIKSVDRAVAVPGDLLTYSLTVRNIGPAPLTAVTVSDAVPTELTYVPPAAGEIVAGPLPAYDPAQQRLTWSIGVIAPGVRVPITFRARVAEGVRSGVMVSNTATVETHETEPIVSNPANTLIQYADLAIAKSPDRTPVVVGQEVTYTVVITNRADGTTDSTWVSDLLPQGFVYVSGSTLLRSSGLILSDADPAADGGSASDQGEAWRWNLGRMGAYEADTLTYRALVTGDAGPGPHDNRAIGCGVTPMGREICTDPVVATVTVVVPALTITKTTPDRSVDIGDVVLYRVHVQNNSTAPVVDLEIRDHLPIGFQILPGSTTRGGDRIDDPVLWADGLPAGGTAGPVGSHPGQDIAVWSIPHLAGGGEVDLAYTVVVGLNAAGGVASNLVEAVGIDEGGGRVAAGPAEARVFVLEDELPGRLRGRIIIDCDGDGRPDQPEPRNLRLAASGTLVDERGDVVTGLEEGVQPPYEGIEVLVEDGRRVRTDRHGVFFVYPLERGDHVVYLDPRSLDKETRILDDDSEFFTVLEGGEARIEFRICPPPPKQGTLQLVKSVTPAEVMAVRRVLEPEVFLVEGILFDTGRATMRPEATRVIGEAGQRLLEDLSATARIEGHTDIRPIRTAEFADNYALSEARAGVVRDALVDRFGLATQRFTVRGFGPDRPLAPNTTARNQSLNRRTEIIILPSLDTLSTAALFEPSEIEYAVRVAYEGSFPPGEGTIGEATVLDATPSGIEYLLGSTRINGQPGDDPDILLERTPDSVERLLAWKLGVIRPGDAFEIRYRAVITDVPRPGRSNTYGGELSPTHESVADTEARHVAEVDSLLRDPVFRNGHHLWENRTWFSGLRDDSSGVRTDAAGADLQLTFERTLEPIKITIEDVLFETAQAVLRPEAFGILDPAAEIIRARPGCRVRIEGHTDIRPIHTERFPSNQELSDARAQAVCDYFVKTERLDAEAFSVRGFGPRRPAADNETAAGRQKNRRVEIIILGEEAEEESFKPVAPGRYPQSVKVDLR